MKKNVALHWPFNAIPTESVPFQALNARASGSYSVPSHTTARTKAFDLDVDLDRAAISAETRAVHADLATKSFRSLPD